LNFLVNVYDFAKFRAALGMALRKQRLPTGKEMHGGLVENRPLKLIPS